MNSNNLGDLTFHTMANDWKTITGKTLPELKTQILEDQIPELKKYITGFGASALNIFDVEENKFLFVDDTIELVTGIPRKLYFTKGAKYIFTKATFSHMPKIVSSTLHQRRFFNAIDEKDYDNFIVNREFSYRGDEPKWVLHQVLKHIKNTKGKVFAVAVLQTSIATIKSDRNFRYYIYNKETNSICYPKQKNSTQKSYLNQLSSREREIVSLLKKGQTNKEIADVLYISFHTVRTHRKNIFKKLNCKNIVDLIKRIQ